MSPSMARIMPTIYQDRCDISLYDAQYSDGKRGPIPQKVIDDILVALVRFKRTCEDFGVPKRQIRVVATEATRKAINGQGFRDQIEARTNLKVDLLGKETEGSIGALGIASSFSAVNGLVLDLGGGSVQLTWVRFGKDCAEVNSGGSVSLPYGAAAVTNLMKEKPGAQERAVLREQMVSELGVAINNLQIPLSLTEDTNSHGLTLYLSGGGFRGWGYLLMSKHAIQPYPIPIINGFSVSSDALMVDDTDLPSGKSTFRISSRRASQAPAVSLLLQALLQCLPKVSRIYFAQGGLREGLLFSDLAPSIQFQHPLITATLPYAPVSTAILLYFLQSAVPSPLVFASDSSAASLSSPSFLTSIIHLLHAHSSLPEDIRAAAALRSTTTGLLASAYGVSHHERALLALVLCERCGAELSDGDTQFYTSLTNLVGLEASWWARYLGRVAQGIGDLFPSGWVRKEREDKTMRLNARFVDVSSGNMEDKSRAVVLEIVLLNNENTDVTTAWSRALEKLGKKKNWSRSLSREFGYKVQAHVITN